MRRAVRVLVVTAVGLGIAALLALGLLIANAHRAIRAVHPPLPEVEAVVSADATAVLPTGVFVVDTARQAMPRSAVLDPERDPDPDAPYVMTHPSFVLAWPDARLFLIDVGMDRESARSFGAPLEIVSGADPIEPRGSIAELLGPAVSRVRGLAFTHLHTDHTSGIASLCDAASADVPVFQTPIQRDGVNYTTRSGRAQIAAASCARPTALDDAPLAPVPGFEGLYVVAAGGHTPGSQVLVAHVRGQDGIRTWIFTGDVVNHRDAIAGDVPKPWLYSLLVVPEDTERLAALRGWLAALAARPRVRIAVSHDAAGLEARGAPPWPPFLPDARREPDPVPGSGSWPGPQLFFATIPPSTGMIAPFR